MWSGLTERRIGYVDGMRRMALSVLVLGALLASAGCAAASGPTPDDVATWQSWFHSASEKDAGDVAVLGGAPSAAASDDGGISVAFGSPTSVAEVNLACTGGSRMTFSIRVTGRGATSIDSIDVPCDQAAETIRLRAAAADAVLVDAVEPGGTGMWSAHVRG